MDILVVLLTYSLMPTLHVISGEWSGNELDFFSCSFFYLFVFRAQKSMAAKTKTKKSKIVTMTYKSGVVYFNTTTTTAHHPSQGMGRKR